MKRDRMTEQLDRIEKMLNELIAWKTGMEERCKTHLAVTKEHHATLYENPGLRSRVENLEYCKGNLNKVRNFSMDVLKMLVVATIIAMIAWLLFMYKKG